MESRPWVLRVEGGSGGMIADPAEVRRALSLFAEGAKGFQVVALISRRGKTVAVGRARAGTDIEGLTTDAAQLPYGQGVYFTVNPVEPTLPKKASAKDILRRRWIYVDIDPVKADGHAEDSATDEEKERTRAVCERVRDYLDGAGWPPPIVTDSGNGFGLFYPADLAADKLVHAHLRRLNEILSAKFDGPDGKVDEKVHNADRLAKLPGTWARKGPCTDDRPHRPCKLLYVPEVSARVGMTELAAVAELEDRPRRNGQVPVRPVKAGVGWGKAALSSECARLALAAPGGRDNALVTSAFRMGQIIDGCGLASQEVEDRLYDAVCRTGLDQDAGYSEASLREKIRRTLAAGQESPREPPERPADPLAKFGPVSPPPAPGSRLTVSLADVKPLEVEWLIRNRVAKRFITVFAGRTSVGKSFVAGDLIARLSRGAEIPFSGGECFAPGGTLILSEDSLEYVLAPRLINAGADMGRIHAMTWEAMAKYSLGDTDMLTKAVAEVPGGVSLVLIDPPTNFLEGTDEHKNSEVRQLVMRVVEWALKRDLAVVFILHVNKQSGKGVEALNRVMGSVAWVTTARIAHAFSPDPDDRTRCLWVPLKNNLGPLPKAIAYRIPEGAAPVVEWVGEIDTTADEAMGHAGPRQRRDIVAADWLVERFAEELEWESKDLFERAKQDGVSRDAIFEAKRSLQLPRARQHTKENGDKTFFWWVPADWPPLVAMGQEKAGPVPRCDSATVGTEDDDGQ